eukprot:TRINITY_DN484_c0_g1_i1.p1 TRINITY_DN484_c0_g1~~TRINITY_DN484_c0_g1_i1.p1  ORF type:complete len:619 (+),score=218.28 TRINITY_DN484_c0_g1_i1:71-1927(+)
MSFKIVLKDETKRVAKIPESFASMIEAIKSAFKGKISASFVTKYIDADGDYVTVASEEDFVAMVQTANGNIKVIIMEDPLANSQTTANLESMRLSDDIIVLDEPKPAVETLPTNMTESVITFEEKPKEALEPQPEAPQTKEESREHVIECRRALFHRRSELTHQVRELKENIKQLKKQKKLFKGDQEALRDLKERKSALKSKKKELKHELSQIGNQIKGHCESLSRMMKCQKEKNKINAEEISPDLVEEKLRGVLEDLLPTITRRVLVQIRTHMTGAQAQQAQNAPAGPAQAPPQQPSGGNQVVHPHVRCDGCNVKPIVGPRYKCTVCEDFDFCSNCEANQSHPHSFIKINDPSKAPSFIMTVDNDPANQGDSFHAYGVPRWGRGRGNGGCHRGHGHGGRNWGNLIGHFAQKINSYLHPGQQQGQWQGPNCQFQAQQGQWQGQQQGQQQGDGPIIVEYEQISVIPKEIFPNRERIWVTVLLKNTGLGRWPKNLILHNLAGLNSNDKIQVPELNPGENHKVTVLFENPQKVGEFASVWRLGYVKDEQVEYIGPEIALSFEVREEKKAEPRQNYPEKVVERAKLFLSIFPHLDLQKILPVVNNNMSKQDDELGELLLDLN